LPTIRFVFLYLIIAILYSLAFSAETITVVTKEQTRYPNVSYRVDSPKKLVIINWRGWQKPIKFSDIDTIYNRKGIEVTSNILRDNADVVKISTIPEYVIGHENEYKMVWKGFVRGGGNFSIPLRGYSDFIGEGIGYEVDFHLALSYRTAIRLRASKSGLRLLSKYNWISGDSDTRVLNESIKFSVIRYTIGIENYGHFDRLRRNLDLWYICIGAGVARHSFEAKATLMSLPDSMIYRLKGTDCKSEPVITYGVGIIKDISNNAGIDFSIGLDMVLLSQDPNKNYITLILDFKIALVKFF
jgi:hypothetical protein